MKVCETVGIKWAPGGVTAPRGFKAAGAAAGLKRAMGALDVAVLWSEAPARVAARFTRNLVQAAPIQVCREHLAATDGLARAVAVNAGNANACTGLQGLADAREEAVLVAAHLGLTPEEVLIASTGVIGAPLPLAKVRSGLEAAVAELSASGGSDAARAIMTTDKVPKEYAVEIQLGGATVRLGGMAKGSGMIHPNLGTMLAFLTSDVVIEPAALQAAFTEVVGRTFNAISVDGDTSTNDTALLLCNGLAGNAPVVAETPEYNLFVAALAEVAGHLAREMVRDGEGATKFITITVSGAPDNASAMQVAKSIATSSLVKTAFFGEDANWGRILAAAGYSGATFDPARVNIAIGGRAVARGGTAVAFSESDLKQVLSQRDIDVLVDLDQGSGHAAVWTCDLSYEYVKINGSYRS